MARADCYLGLVGGLALGTSQHQDALLSGDFTGSFNVNGGTGGAVAGCRWPLGGGWLGVEADYAAANVEGSVVHNPPNQAYTAETSVDRISTFRVVVGGNLTKNWAIFGSAGLATAPTKAKVCALSGGYCESDTQTLVGFAGGLSSEYAFTPSLRMRLEYLYLGFEEKQFNTGPISNPRNVDLGLSQARIGLELHF